MSKVPFVSPVFQKDGFNCPHCNAYSDQAWKYAGFWDGEWNPINGLQVAFCAHCKNYSVWRAERMVHPLRLNAPLAHADMPEDIRSDYDEARSIADFSPRSAAALLRLCIQKLCKALGEPGKNINEDIASLVTKGLPITVQKALDIVRVVGNEQVHPGTLDVRDDPNVATELFGLVNFIVENQIAQPKAIQELYGRLPEGKRRAIEERDAKSEQQAPVGASSVSKGNEVV